MIKSLLCVVAMAVMLSAPALADTGRTLRAEFFPMFEQGALTGCQVSFSVLRIDDEFSTGAPTLANGLLVFAPQDGGRPGAMLRLGIARAHPIGDFAPPDRAFLLHGFQTNSAEVGSGFLSDSPGFRVFPYALGEVTSAAIVDLTISGRLEMSYGMPNTTVDARVVADLMDSPEVMRDWGLCVETVLGRTSGRAEGTPP